MELAANSAQVAGLRWPLPEGLTAADLERQLFSEVGRPTGRAIPQPDWHDLHIELKRKSVTLSLLWVEYRQAHPDGYGYSHILDETTFRITLPDAGQTAQALDAADASRRGKAVCRLCWANGPGH
jgi:transposase